jgi:hypothetical protein
MQGVIIKIINVPFWQESQANKFSPNQKLSNLGYNYVKNQSPEVLDWDYQELRQMSEKIIRSSKNESNFSLFSNDNKPSHPTRICSEDSNLSWQNHDYGDQSPEKVFGLSIEKFNNFIL